MQVSSLGLVSWFVAAGEGVGLAVDLPALVNRPGVQRLPLDGFGLIDVGAMWRAPASALVQTALDVIVENRKSEPTMLLARASRE